MKFPISDLVDELQLHRQSPERCTEVALALADAIKSKLGFYSESTLPDQVQLYPCEVLAVQRFLNQFGFHLEFIQTFLVLSIKDMNDLYSYRVVPNWK